MRPSNFNIKKWMMMAVIVGSVGLASQVSAVLLDTSSTEYLGSIHSGEPSSDANKAIFINNKLNALVPNGNLTVDLGFGPGTEAHEFTRSGNTLWWPTCATATDVGTASSSSNSPGTVIDVVGFTYPLEKYNGANSGNFVWYVADVTGTVDIATTWGPSTDQYGLSHCAAFNSDGGPPPTDFAEPRTLFVIGSGLVLLASSVRRRMVRK